ncbi:MAG: polysaccharide deacetylase family protein [Bacteroidetes bacterium]|nr:polysaccharide deacetylase family protein [Bacteroidota bacterium]
MSFFFVYKDEGVPAFLFHNTPTNFEELLKVIQRSKVHTYTFDEIYDLHLQHLPVKVDSCLLTFDDGYKDNYFIAFPLLKQYKIKATIFINTASIGHDPDYLTWNQIQEMYKSGLVDFELHSHRHAAVFVDTKVVRTATEDDLKDWNLQYLYRNELKLGDPIFKTRSAYSERAVKFEESFYHNRDLSAIRFETDDEAFIRISEDIDLNKGLIESNLKKAVHFFCWPWGHRSEFGKQIIKKAGIIGFLSTRKGTNPRKINMEHIQRIEHRNYTTFKFWITLKVCQNLFLGRIYQILS